MVLLTYIPNVVEPWWSLIVGKTVPELLGGHRLVAATADWIAVAFPTLGMVSSPMSSTCS